MDNDGYISNGELFQVKHHKLKLFSLKSFLKKQSKAQLFRSSKKKQIESLHTLIQLSGVEDDGREQPEGHPVTAGWCKKTNKNSANFSCSLDRG